MEISIHKTLRAFALAALVIGAAAPATAIAQSTADPSTASGLLDGMDFSGQIGPVDSSKRQDTLHFQAGHFWSRICTECGFFPGPYWTRRVGATVEFRGILESPERGRFLYEGVVSDGQIRVSVNWRRERWYWTIDRNLAFEGEVMATPASYQTLGEARKRASGSVSPDCPQ